MIIIVNKLKLKPWQWPSHGTHLAAGVHQEARGIDHAKPLDEPEIETLFKWFPGVRRTACRKHYPHRVISIIRPLRLFQQYGDHSAKGVELHSVVLSAIVPVP